MISLVPLDIVSHRGGQLDLFGVCILMIPGRAPSMAKERTTSMHKLWVGSAHPRYGWQPFRNFCGSECSGLKPVCRASLRVSELSLASPILQIKLRVRAAWLSHQPLSRTISLSVSHCSLSDKLAILAPALALEPRGAPRRIGFASSRCL